MPHPRTVTPIQLTALMLTLIIVPILGGVLLYRFSPKVGEPTLPAQIKISTVWLDELNSEGGEAIRSELEDSAHSGTFPSAGPSAGAVERNRRLVQCIVVKNLSGVVLGKLSIGLNDQFFSTGNKSILPDAEVSIPLESFIARNGSVRFPVGNRPIHKATVFAQIGTGARGVSEYHFVGDEQTGMTEWKDPSPKD